MAGFQLVVSGDFEAARSTVAEILKIQGYTTEVTGEWTARAERGSKGGSIALGAFSGKSGRHVILDIAFASNSDSNFTITLTEGTSGMSGGLIGLRQAKAVYSEAYTAIGNAFQASGNLVSGTSIK